MRSLLLFRHAKSSWDDPRLSDHDRPLNRRGIKAAPRMGRYITEHDLLPDLILCSTAVRTRETLRLAFEDQADALPDIKFEPGMYEASYATLLKIIQSTGPEVQSLMLIGHNPGMQILAFALSQEDDSDHRQHVARKYPTAGLARLTFDVDEWTSVLPGTGVLHAFVTPKMLD